MTRWGQGKSFEELIDALANCEFNSVCYNQVMAELTHNRIIEERKAAEETRKIATDVAEISKKSARYSLWSASAAAISAIASVVAVVISLAH